MHTTGAARNAAGSADQAGLAGSLPDLGGENPSGRQATPVAATSCTSRSEICARLRISRVSPSHSSATSSHGKRLVVIVTNQHRRAGMSQQRVPRLRMRAQINRKVEIHASTSRAPQFATNSSSPIALLALRTERGWKKVEIT